MARVVVTFEDEDDERCHVTLEAEPPLNDPYFPNTAAQALAIKAMAFLATMSGAQSEAEATWGDVDEARPINLRPGRRPEP